MKHTHECPQCGCKFAAAILSAPPEERTMLPLGKTIVPTRFLTDFLKAINWHGGHGTPSFDRVQAICLSGEAEALLLSTSANTSASSPQKTP